MKKRSKQYLERHLRAMEGGLSTIKRMNKNGTYYIRPYRTGYFDNQIQITKARLLNRSNT